MCPVLSTGWITALRYMSFSICNQSSMTLSCYSPPMMFTFVIFIYPIEKGKTSYEKPILKISQVSLVNCIYS